MNQTAINYATALYELSIPGEAVDGRLVTSDYERLTGADICGHVQQNFRRQAFVQNDVNAAIAGYCARRQTPEDDETVFGLDNAGKLSRFQSGRRILKGGRPIRFFQ